MKIWLTCAVYLGTTASALAGGMFLPARGVRSLARAGAFTAGADDADALWLDPAGLANLGAPGTRAALFDVAYVYQQVDYSPIDTTGNPQAPVSNLQPGRIPIPTIAYGLVIDDRFSFAAGLAAPYSGLHRYDASGTQRYSSVELQDQTFVIVTVGGAYRVSDRLRLGATLQNTVSTMHWTTMVSMCPGSVSCARDDRSYDAPMTIEQTDRIAPSGSLGIQFDARDDVKLGLTLQAPTRVSSPSKLTLALPSATFFDGAKVSGDSASVAYTLPATVHAGIEVRPTSGLRVEADLAVELWSMHDGITIEPHGIRVEEVQGINAYKVHTMTIARDYKTTFSPSVAIEYREGSAMLGCGVAYETAASPAGNVSVLGVDGDKILVGLGGGYDAEGWQLGGAFGIVSVSDVELPRTEARMVQVQPLRDMPAQVIINAGSYQTSYFMAGLRATRRF